MHAIYSKHSQQKYTQHCISKSPDFILDIATVVTTKIETFHGGQRSSDFRTCPEAQEWHCVWKQTPSQTWKSAKKLVHTKFCCTTQTYRANKGGRRAVLHLNQWYNVPMYILSLVLIYRCLWHTLGAPTSRGSAVSMQSTENWTFNTKLSPEEVEADNNSHMQRNN